MMSILKWPLSRENHDYIVTSVNIPFPDFCAYAQLHLYDRLQIKELIQYFHFFWAFFFSCPQSTLVGVCSMNKRVKKKSLNNDDEIELSFRFSKNWIILCLHVWKLDGFWWLLNAKCYMNGKWGRKKWN